MTLKFKRQILLVEGEYQPYAPMDLEYPGCPEGYEITSVKDLEGGDVEMDTSDWDELNDLALETYKGNVEEAEIEAYLDSKDD